MSSQVSGQCPKCNKAIAVRFNSGITDLFSGLFDIEEGKNNCPHCNESLLVKVTVDKKYTLEAKLFNKKEGEQSKVVNANFPVQGDYLGRRVKVCFNHDLRNSILGTIVRDDITGPGLTIINLDDGRSVLSTECQYHVLKN